MSTTNGNGTNGTGAHRHGNSLNFAHTSHPALPVTAGSRFVSQGEDGKAVLNRAFIDSLATLTHNAMQSRTEWLKKLGDPRRDIDDECGYAKRLTIQDFKEMYDREPVAGRVVEAIVKESWALPPTVYEDENEENVTDFEQAWDDLGKTLGANGGTSWHQDEEGSPVWEYLKRADTLSRIGRFGILFIGFDDGLDLSQPVPGSVEEGTDGSSGVEEATDANAPEALKRVGPLTRRKAKRDKPVTNAELKALRALPDLRDEETAVLNRLEAEAAEAEQTRNRIATAKDVLSSGRPSTAPLGAESTYFDLYGDATGEHGESPALKPKKQDIKVLFLRAFSEDLVQVVRYEWNPTNPRFGQPLMYRVTFNDPDEQGGSGAVGLPLATLFVHWSRVIHIADVEHHARSSEIFAAEAMRPVWNRLWNIRKTSGAAGEGYWRGGVPGLIVETPPNAGGEVIVDDPQLRDDLEQYQNGFQRVLRLTNLQAKSLAPAVTDPTPFLDADITAIAMKCEMPKRVLMGSERGELASSQDDASWNDRCHRRRTGYIQPRIVVPFIDRLILVGALPEPDFVAPVAAVPGDALTDTLPPSEGETKAKEVDAKAAGAPTDGAGGPPPTPGALPKKPKVPGKAPSGPPVGNAAPPSSVDAPSPPGKKAAVGAPIPAKDTEGEEVGDAAGQVGGEADGASTQTKPVGYRIYWPDLDSTTDADKANIAGTLTTAMAAYVSGGLDALIPPLDYLTKICGFDVVEAKMMLAVAEAAAQKAQEEAQAIADEHGLVPELEGFKDPNEAPPVVVGKPGEAPPKDSWSANGPPATNALEDEWEDWDDDVTNGFCPTGEGGGIDPSCGKKDFSKSVVTATVYHGSDKDLREYKGKSSAPRAGDPLSAHGIWFSADEGTTRRYGSVSNPAKILLRNPARMTVDDLMEWDDANGGVKYKLTDRDVKRLKKAGHDGVIFRKATDKQDEELGLDGEWAHEQYVVFSKSNIRLKKRKPPATNRLDLDDVLNVFCSTGEGGGIDPTCGEGGGPAQNPGGGAKGGNVAAQTAKAPAKGPPNAADLEKANEGKRLHPNVTVKKDANGTEWVVKGRNGKGSGVQNEATAAALAKHVPGLDVIPVHPQKHNGGDVAVSPMTNGKTLSSMSDGDARAAIAKVPKKELDQQALFDYALGSGDPNRGNYMIRPDGGMTSLDKEQSLNHGSGMGSKSGYHPPSFLELAVQQGTPAVRYEFDRRTMTAMSTAAQNMADDLEKQGKKKEAQGVRRRAEVMARVAASDKPPTAAELDRVGREYDKTNPAPSSFGGWIRGLVGNADGGVENVFCATGDGGGVDPSCSPGRESVGRGNTGHVYKEGDEVVKGTKRGDGVETKEGEVYDALRGTVGVAPGRRVGDTIRLPHYQEILSVDAVPNARDREGMGGVIADNTKRLLNAVNALSDKGYDYNDPIQVGFDNDYRSHLFDFSNAGKVPVEEARRANIGRLTRYMEEFGAKNQADQINMAFSVYSYARGLKGNPESAKKRIDKQAEMGRKSADYLKSMGAERVAGYDGKHVYYATNPRPVERTGILQSEYMNNMRVILSDKPMDADTIRMYNLVPVVHPAEKE